MKSADADWHVPMQKRPRQIDGAGKLVRLNPTQADKRSTTGSSDHSDDPIGSDASIGLVVSVDADSHVGANHPPPTGVFGETVEASECVRRYRRLDPLNRIAVVIVMRRLDQYHVEDDVVAVAHGCRCRRYGRII